jgi:hypothetical protein
MGADGARELGQSDQAEQGDRERILPTAPAAPFVGYGKRYFVHAR